MTGMLYLSVSIDRPSSSPLIFWLMALTSAHHLCRSRCSSSMIVA